MEDYEEEMIFEEEMKKLNKTAFKWAVIIVACVGVAYWLIK